MSIGWLSHPQIAVTSAERTLYPPRRAVTLTDAVEIMPMA